MTIATDPSFFGGQERTEPSLTAAVFGVLFGSLLFAVAAVPGDGAAVASNGHIFDGAWPTC